MPVECSMPGRVVRLRTRAAARVPGNCSRFYARAAGTVVRIRGRGPRSALSGGFRLQPEGCVRRSMDLSTATSLPAEAGSHTWFGRTRTRETANRGPRLYDLLDDIRQTLRGLARSKLATAVLLVSLAVGTGANATLYSVMDALLFRPPPGVTGSSRLAWVHTSQFNGASYGPTSYPDFVSMKQAAPAFQSLAAFDDSQVTVVRLGDSSQRVRVVSVSPEFFPTLGMGGSVSLAGTGRSAAGRHQRRLVEGPRRAGRPDRPAADHRRRRSRDRVGRAVALRRPAAGAHVRCVDSSGAGVCGDGARRSPAVDCRSSQGRLGSRRRVARARRRGCAPGDRVSGDQQGHAERRGGAATVHRHPLLAAGRLGPSAGPADQRGRARFHGSAAAQRLRQRRQPAAVAERRAAARARRQARARREPCRAGPSGRRREPGDFARRRGARPAAGEWTAGVLPAFFAPEEAAMLDTRLDGFADRHRHRVVVRCGGALRHRAGAPCPSGRGRAGASRGRGRDRRAQRRTLSRRRCRRTGRALDRAADCQRADGSSARHRPRGRPRTRTGAAWRLRWSGCPARSRATSSGASCFTGPPSRRRASCPAPRPPAGSRCCRSAAARARCSPSRPAAPGSSSGRRPK